MSDIVIKVENIAKKYLIGGKQEPYKRLTETLMDLLTAPIKHLKGINPDPLEEIWVLRDVSFQIKVGEVVGIIGRNGAGKSTLLKILSRITEPTAGQAEIRGKVGSLLEVGTGFHPELTGRENVFLSGSILGMRKADIKKRFDEIVDFSGIEKFIDTPVKRYSSGMYTRLAFAVAAHLETDILLVDEVLAVGDALFQKKCLKKMSEVSKGGRTVFFVSHNLLSVISLTRRSLWFESGLLKGDGPSDGMVESYVSSIQGDVPSVFEAVDLSEELGLIIRSMAITSKDGASTAGIFYCSEDVPIEIHIEKLRDMPIELTLYCMNEYGLCVFETSSVHGGRGRLQKSGDFAARFIIPGNLLNEGTYHFDAALVKNARILKKIENIFGFEIHRESDSGLAWFGKSPGIIRPIFEWMIR